MLYRFTPEEMRFIMIDPKVVEMQIYNTLPHLVIPVVTDPKKVLLALRWVIDEMEKRYKIFAKTGVRNITSFNARPKPKSQEELDAEKPRKPEKSRAERRKPSISARNPDDELIHRRAGRAKPIQVPRDDEIIVPDRMPYIVVIIDELADLMQTAPADVESAIARITQMARAAGIHMIVATQTPRADVVTGVIKANIPTPHRVPGGQRPRFAHHSRRKRARSGCSARATCSTCRPGTSRMTRAQGVLVTDDEIRRLVDFVSAQGAPVFEAAIHEKIQSAATRVRRKSPRKTRNWCRNASKSCGRRKRPRPRFSSGGCVSATHGRRAWLTFSNNVVTSLPGEGAKPREILKDLDTLPL